MEYVFGSEGNDTLLPSFQGDGTTFGLGGNDTLSGVNSNSDSPGVQNLYGGEGSDHFDLYIGTDWGGSGINYGLTSNNESFVNVLDFGSEDSIAIDIGGVSDVSRIYRFYNGTDYYSNIFVDADSSGYVDDHVATIKGSSFVYESDLF